MVVRANIVKNKTIGVDLNQKAGGFNAPVQSVNGKTGDVVLVATDVGALPDTTSIPSKVSELENDNGYLTSYTETDPTVPAWAKAPQKPSYTFAEVGADPEGSAVSAVSNHNTNQYSHQDIRLLIEGLNSRLNALADSDDITLDQMSELVAYIKDNRELIEGVTTNKVNVSDIINNLTTNVSNKPLSAAQGVILKGLINDLENSKANQTELDELSDWTHQAVDELVDAVIKPNKTETAFNFISSDTLSWNGDTTGKVAVYSADKILYVHVSSIVPTAEDLQNGGMCAWIGSENCPFVSGDIVETSDYIIPEIYDSVVIAKKDNATYNTLVFPTQGIYFAYDTSERRVESLTINEYTGFIEPVLKMESLTPHGHDWYGKPINKGNTVRSDNTIYDGYVKVSDAVPTLAEVQKGGTLRFYDVVDGELSGDLIVGDYLESPYSVISSSGEIWIASDGIIMVQIKADGVYFRQDQYGCMHSLTINGYEGFNYNFEKIPAEFLPENIGGGADWNAQEGEDGYIANKPFGEETVMGDTLTWDGNTDGLYNVLGMFYCVSDVIPTLEDLQNGGTIIFNGSGRTFTSSDIMDMGALGAGSNCYIVMSGETAAVGIVLKEGATATMEGITVTFEKAGIYFLNNSSLYTSSFTINGYAGFETTEIKTIDPKYLPEAGVLFTFESIDNSNPANSVVICNKTFGELDSMSIEKLTTGVAIYTDGATDACFKVQNVTRFQASDDVKIIAFEFFRIVITSSLDFFVVKVQNDDTVTVSKTIL